MKKVLVLLLVGLLALTLVACGGGEEEEETGLPEATAFEVSELVGIWGNRSGQSLRSPFSSSIRPTVQFLEDNTFISYNTHHEVVDTMVWQITETGHLALGRHEFAIAINGNILTVTDDRGNQAVFQGIDAVPEAESNNDAEVEEVEEPVAAVVQEEPEESASSSDADWRRFIAEYDDWVTRFLRAPDDLSLLAEMADWTGRAEQYTANLSASELVEFSQELARIMERMTG